MAGYHPTYNAQPVLWQARCQCFRSEESGAHGPSQRRQRAHGALSSGDSVRLVPDRAGLAADYFRARSRYERPVVALASARFQDV
jgi:hypothetical protein